MDDRSGDFDDAARRKLHGRARRDSVALDARSVGAAEIFDGGGLAALDDRVVARGAGVLDDDVALAPPPDANRLAGLNDSADDARRTDDLERIRWSARLSVEIEAPEGRR